MMVGHSILVDIFNPGQVFASLGFLEAADELLGDVEGGFDWTDEANIRFILQSTNERNPFEVVLEFLAKAEVVPIVPERHTGLSHPSVQTETFPAPKVGKRSDNKKRSITEASLPCRLKTKEHKIDFGHWADCSTRDNFKQFAGQQSAYGTIIPPLLNGIKELWKNERLHLDKPLNEMMPIKKGKASFMLDARAAWTVRDLGYSRDEQGYSLMASPVVELLGAIGLEHARPSVDSSNKLKVTYGVWGEIAPLILARPIIGGTNVGIPTRLFQFTRNALGKDNNYKQVTFAKEIYNNGKRS